MVTAKSLVVGAFAIAVIATAIRIAALVSPHFVDVHLVRDLSEKSDSNRIAGVGVFQAEFDATDPNLAAAAFEAGIPPIAIDTPTLEFPLLFPSQENFFPEVLPLNANNLVLLEAAISGSEAFIPAIEAAIAGVAAVEFDNCGDFIGEITNASFAYFFVLQNVVIPPALRAIHQQSIDAAEDIFFPPIDDLYGAGPASFIGLMTVFLPAASLADLGAGLIPAGCEPLVLDLVNVFNGTEALDNVVAACVGQVLTSLAREVDDVAKAFGQVVALRVSECADDEVGIFECILGTPLFLISNETPLQDAAAFGEGTTPCDVGVICDGDTTTRDFLLITALSLSQISDFFIATGVEDLIAIAPDLLRLAGALQFYAGEGSARVITGEGSVSTRFDALVVDEVLDGVIFEDQDFEQDFSNLCNIMEGILDILSLVEGARLELPDNCTTLEGYLASLPFFVGLDAEQAELGLIVGALNDQLYSECFFAQQNENFPFPIPIETNGDCPFLFAGGFVAGIVGSDDAVQGCEDDVEDNEKIATAQGLVISSTFFLSVGLLMILGALFVSGSFLKLLSGISALLFLLAGVLTISGLFVVESAPVYDNVGEEPDGDVFEPIFFQGYVGVLALVDSVMLIISSLILTGSLCKSDDSGESSEYDEKPAKAQPHTGKMEDNL